MSEHSEKQIDIIATGVVKLHERFDAMDQRFDALDTKVDNLVNESSQFRRDVRKELEEINIKLDLIQKKVKEDVGAAFADIIDLRQRVVLLEEKLTKV